MNTVAHRIAALLYLLPLLGIGVIWLIPLGGNGSGPSFYATLGHHLFDSEYSRQLQWMIVLPALCGLLAGAHVSPIARMRFGPLLLFALGLCLAVAAWRTAATAIAFLVSLPVLFAFLAAK